MANSAFWALGVPLSPFIALAVAFALQHGAITGWFARRLYLRRFRRTYARSAWPLAETRPTGFYIVRH